MRSFYAIYICALLACGPQTPGETATTTESGSTAEPGSSTGTSGDDSTGAPTTGESTNDATTGTTGTTDDPSTGEPACLDVHEFGFDPDLEFTCGLPELCPGDASLVFDLAGGVEDLGVESISDVERARCMIAALRDRTPGHFMIRVWPKDQLGEDELRDEIFGDTAARRRVSQNDFNIDRFEFVKPLRPPQFFADCLADGSDSALWACLWDAFEDTCVTTLACP